MKIFHCVCGATLFFENVRCLACKRDLGFLPDRQTLSALEGVGNVGAPDAWQALAASGARYRKCQNYTGENVCNWMIPAGESEPFCVACRLNETIPSLSANPNNRAYWAKLETAKRRLVYSLLALRLPIRSRQEDPERGLAFAFLESPRDASATDGGSAPAPVMTGHADGLITINVAEADDVEREQVRRQMHEAYRTVLGHFRHEVGHYYWDRLIDGTRWLPRFRELFGDERDDYAQALERHYASGGAADWQKRYISVYASSHPWEDWAETWAHYFQMLDTTETAGAFGVSPHGAEDGLVDEALFRGDSSGRPTVTSPELVKMLRKWIWLSLATNSINRSMGMRDANPFILNTSVAQKLAFVHEVIASAGASGPASR